MAIIFQEIKKQSKLKIIFRVILIALAVYGGYIGFYQGLNKYQEWKTGQKTKIPESQEHEKYAFKLPFGDDKPKQTPLSPSPLPSPSKIIKEPSKSSKDSFESEKKIKSTVYPAEKAVKNNYQMYFIEFIRKNAAPIKQGDKDKIFNILEFLKFPPKLINDVLFVVIDSESYSPQTFIKVPEDENSYPLENLKSLGKIAIIHTEYPRTVIYVLSESFYADSFEVVFTHELGHVITRYFTNENWEKWRELRNIPADIAIIYLPPPKIGVMTISLKYSLNEDFAEVYKIAFGSHKGNPESWEVGFSYWTSPYWNKPTQEQKQFIEGILEKYK